MIFQAVNFNPAEFLNITYQTLAIAGLVLAAFFGTLRLVRKYIEAKVDENLKDAIAKAVREAVKAEIAPFARALGDVEGQLTNGIKDRQRRIEEKVDSNGEAINGLRLIVARLT